MKHLSRFALRPLLTRQPKGDDEQILIRLLFISLLRLSTLSCPLSSTCPPLRVNAARTSNKRQTETRNEMKIKLNRLRPTKLCVCETEGKKHVARFFSLSYRISIFNEKKKKKSRILKTAIDQLTSDGLVTAIYYGAVSSSYFPVKVNLTDSPLLPPSPY